MLCTGVGEPVPVQFRDPMAPGGRLTGKPGCTVPAMEPSDNRAARALCCALFYQLETNAALPAPQGRCVYGSLSGGSAIGWADTRFWVTLSFTKWSVIVDEAEAHGCAE